MDRDSHRQKSLGLLPSRFGTPSSKTGRFVNRSARRNLFTGEDLSTSNAITNNSLEMNTTSPNPPTKSPTIDTPGRIPRPVRSLSGLNAMNAKSKTASSAPGTRRLSSTPSDIERPASAASSTTSVRSESRIPRPSLARSQQPKTQPQKRITLTEAFMMTAEEAELGRNSPSPAPRVAAQRRSEEKSKLQRLMNQSPLDIHRMKKSTGWLADDVSLSSSISRSSIPQPARVHEDMKEANAFEKRFEQFERDQRRKSGVLERQSGFFNRTNVGERVAQTGKQLVRKASNNSLKENDPARPRTWGSKGRVNNDWMQRAFVSPAKPSQSTKIVPPQDIPLPSVEIHPPAAAMETPIASSEPTPGKEFMQMDAEFTEGDLQISDSPRVTFLQDNSEGHRQVMNQKPPSETNYLTKDEMGSFNSPERTNQRIEEIRRLEEMAEFKIAQKTIRGNRSRIDSGTRLEEVRDREVQSVSRKALASAILEDILTRNSESLSRSPEPFQQHSSGESQPLQQPTPAPSDAWRSESQPGAMEESVAFQERSINVSEAKSKGLAVPIQSNPNSFNIKSGIYPHSGIRRPSSHQRDESLEHLRQLARVTSQSPQGRIDQAANKNGPVKPSNTKSLPSLTTISKESTGNGEPSDGSRLENIRTSTSPDGINKKSSFESVKSKKSNRSEVDPTNRIQAERDLFEPPDNYSEKNSTPASSEFALTSEDDSENNPQAVQETPRPQSRMQELNSAMQATPRAPGAYVETPATIKIEKAFPSNDNYEEDKERLEVSGTCRSKISSQTSSSSTLQSSIDTIVRPRKISHRKHNSTGNLSPRKSKADAKRTEGREEAITNGETNTLRRRRVRSEPKRPVIVNTAKVPSVKEDLAEIRRLAKIEDSTLDEFDEVIHSHERVVTNLESDLSSPEPESSVSASEASSSKVLSVTTPQTILQSSSRERKAAMREQKKKQEQQPRTNDQVARSMDRRLSNVLQEIRSARNLADKINQDMHSSGKPGHNEKGATTAQNFSSLRLSSLLGNTTMHRLTLTLTIMVLVWAVAEATMCYAFCRPATCGPGVPCNWKPSDPTPGSALPIKLDEWVLGGRGARLANAVSEAVGDTWLDFYCNTLNIGGEADVGKSTTCSYSFEDRKRLGRIQRRRQKQRQSSEDESISADNDQSQQWDDISPGMYRWLQKMRMQDAARTKVSDDSNNGDAGVDGSQDRSDYYQYGEARSTTGYYRDLEDEEEDVGFLGEDEVII